MSRRLDLPLAAAVWLGGFAWVQWKGSWAPLAVLAVLAATRLVATDPETRRLLVPRRSTPALASAGVLGMVGATYAAYALLARLVPGLPAATAGLYGVLHAGGYPRPALAALVVLVSLCEEIVWRGQALRGAARLAGTRPITVPAAVRVAAVALLYGACHLSSGSLLLAFLAFSCGLAWGLLRVAGRSLWPSALVHAGWDLAILVAWPLG